MRFTVLLSMLAVTTLASAQSGPSTLRDTGSKTCSDGQVTTLASGPMAGKASTLLSQAKFARLHRDNTQGEPAWLSSLSAYSTRNFVFTGSKGPIANKRAVVAAVCPAAGCDATRAFVAFAPASGEYGATLVEGRALRQIVPGGSGGSFDEHAPLIDAALHCARELAESQR